MEKARRKPVTFAIKSFVTVGLYAVILWNVDWEIFLKILHRSNLLLMAVALLCMTACVFISSYKWQILLLVHSIRYNFLQLSKYYFVALFVNNFLPTSIGGDSFRIYKTFNNSRSGACAVLAIFVERATGILTLVVLALTSSVILILAGKSTYPDTGSLMWILGVLCLVLILSALFAERVIHWLGQRGRLPAKLRKLPEYIHDYRNNALKTVQVMFLSVFFHFFTFTWMLILLKAVGCQTSIFVISITLAVSNLIALLPISINGIGLMDGSFIYVIGKFGVTYEQALMAMLTVRAFLAILSLVGALLYVTTESRFHDF